MRDGVLYLFVAGETIELKETKKILDELWVEQLDSSFQLLIRN